MSRRTEVRMFPPGDYTARLNAIWREIQAASNDDGTPRLMTEESRTTELEQAYKELHEEATEAAKAERRFVRFEALGRGEWRAIKLKHPPRTETEGDESEVKADRTAGVNLRSVEDDLVYASIVEPAFSSRGDFDEWLDDTLSEGDFEVVLQTAWELANIAQYDPKSLPALLTRKSDATSE